METSIRKKFDRLSQGCARIYLPFHVPSSTAQTYRYRPLKHARKIRLLYLHPGSEQDPLSCSLKIVALSRAPVYEAISYTWGEPIFSASIKCSSRSQLAITENLSVALFHLRLKDRVRVLWVDAICINQQDIVERNHQVRLLRDTFEGAERVIVWLGEEDTGDANEAFEMLQAIQSESLSTYDFRELSRSGRAKALESLLKRSWFLRVWVIQELTCARKAIIMCGNQSMEWERFLDAADRIYSIAHYTYYGSRSLYHTLHVLYQLRFGRGGRRLGKGSSLLALLYCYRLCQASDSRDKIFALVGIADGQTAASYVPDYSKGVVEVYKDLASHLIIAEQDPDVLTHCALPFVGRSMSIPSWVPDWSRPLISNPSPMTAPGAYKVSAGTSFKGGLSGDLNVLSLDGVLLNEVEVLCLVAQEALDHKNVGKKKVELHEEYLKIFRQSHKYKGYDLTAFVRTLVADKDHLGYRMKRQDLIEVYAAHRRFLSERLGVAFVLDEISTTPDGSFGQSVESEDKWNFETAVDNASFGRTFCLFDDGRAGWVPEAAQAGDRVAIFLGATVPILLRPCGNNHLVLGEAYVDEMMDGQAFEEPDVQIETITLI